MKLKKAVKQFRMRNISSSKTYWIAADEDGYIFIYWDHKPTICTEAFYWVNASYNIRVSDKLYTGKKHWTKTLKEFTI